jgi:hypothetical protein
LLHVTSDGLDVRSAVAGVVIIDDLVTGEEEKSVGVSSESIDGREEALKVDVVVRGCGIGAVERVLWSVDVESKVDASSCQRRHALVVIGGVVDRVHTDGIDSQLLELGDISLASRGIRDWVFGLG